MWTHSLEYFGVLFFMVWAWPLMVAMKEDHTAPAEYYIL